MLRNLAWHTTDTLTRVQLSMVLALADQISLSSEDRRKLLSLTEGEWQAWTDFLTDGPLPANPALPEMLFRLGKAGFTLAVLAEGRGFTASQQA